MNLHEYLNGSLLEFVVDAKPNVASYLANHYSIRHDKLAAMQVILVAEDATKVRLKVEGDHAAHRTLNLTEHVIELTHHYVYLQCAYDKQSNTLYARRPQHVPRLQVPR